MSSHSWEKRFPNHYPGRDLLPKDRKKFQNSRRRNHSAQYEHWLVRASKHPCHKNTQAANKHMNIHSPSCVIGEMHIKIPVTRSKVSNNESSNFRQGQGTTWTLSLWFQECRDTATSENFLTVSHKSIEHLT